MHILLFHNISDYRASLKISLMMSIYAVYMHIHIYVYILNFYCIYNKNIILHIYIYANHIYATTLRINQSLETGVFPNVFFERKILLKINKHNSKSNAIIHKG